MSGEKHEAIANDLIAKIKEALPNVKLKFEVIEDYLTIKPESFLGTEVFANLQAKIRELGGDYVSAGKLSHFHISLNPKESADLKEWYSKQKLKSLPFTLTLNLNLQVTPEQLEDILKKVASLQEEKKER